ncbi:cellulose synthase subunit BcsC-related outer membrane protein [Rahnella bonaserana]|uniref:cellulose synthase subunit BcsC-related outer membrane protein n=1 Tax=Rahnella bonaserana TaxID=2816248 RepID=UPI0024C3DA6E|nr:cellulose synthase subunit BcsC-related outer membrane protein [Rahnella bonaserana]WHZ38657.1 cellulose synthase subunit BcsC-related outer membrane protein [Rahnella bonaserana]
MNTCPKVHFPLNRLALTLGLALLAAPAISVPVVSPEQWLLEQVRVGEASHQDDLVRQSLFRLELMDPQNPKVLSARLRLLLREGDQGKAQQQLEKIKQVAPGSDDYRQAELSLKIASPEMQQKLQQTRLLATAGRLDEARAQYDELFGGEPPTLDLAVEYWQLVARLPGQKAHAQAQLQALNNQYPGDVQLRLQLAQMAFEQGDDARAVGLIKQVAATNEGRSPAADLWLARIKDQPVGNASVDALQQFIATFDTGPQVIAAQQELRRQEGLLADPRYQARIRGLAQIDKGGSTGAIASLKQALQATPNDAEVLGAMGLAYSRAGNRQQALTMFQRAKAAETDGYNAGKWNSLIQTNSYWLKIEQGDKALKAGQFDQAEAAYQQAQRLDPRDPWAPVGLGDVAVARKNDPQAEQAYRRALTLERDNSSAQRGLANIYQRQSPQKALDYINSLPAASRAKLSDKQRGLQTDQLTAQAEKYVAERNWNQAANRYAEVLKLNPDDVWTTYHYAGALREGGDPAKADAVFAQFAVKHPSDAQQVYAYSLYLSGSDRNDAALRHLHTLPEARWDNNMREMAQRIRLDKTLTAIDASLAAGNTAQAKQELQQASLQGLSLNQQRRVAMAWLDVGETSRAASLLQPLKAAAASQPAGQDKALIYRNAANVEQQIGQPQLARQDYEQAMVASGITNKVPQDNDSYTRLMRNNSGDDWLKRGIRSDAHDLYRQQDVNFTVDTDSWTSSGTPGKSDLTANTTMFQADMSLYQGRGFLRADWVRMDAGTFDNENGNYEASFGTCSDQNCRSYRSQTANGLSLGAGWENDKWKGDLGTTPLGFPVVNWVGGLAYSGDWGQTGWTTTVSRRPVSSSLLSFAGAKDPGTGTTWGGVIATGGSLGLSYDQGLANGVWADLSAHQLTGKNVEDNTRERLMGGYYYKVINEDNRRATVGLSSMVWHYQKDLSGYTLGQGGYYSPQQYFSVSVPVNYRQRTENWSWQLGGSVSWSRSSTSDQKRYPIQNLIPDSLPDKSAIETGSSGSGFGYTVQALVERRVSAHWTVGGGIDIQQAKDYTPSHFLLYARYSMSGWQGDLDMPPQPLVPYADFK